MNKCVREIMYMRRVLPLALLAVFLCLNYVTKAQSNVLVTGRVADENHQPLGGVAVQVQKSRTGTTTDASGAFSISAPSNATLLITYVGFADTTIAIGGRTTFDIRLSSARTNLSEVVVIGYGVANRRDLTGSIVKVDGKVVADKPNSNPVASLQSKVAGLSVVNNGTPGGAPDIRIRGTGSFGNVHPLYVVDGILNDNIDFLNPNNIESIEILKDPSSLAIFGVKGATGAIVITTKQARAGQTTVSLSSNYGFKKLVDKIKMVDANGFTTLFGEENDNNNVIDSLRPKLGSLTANTDWINEVIRTGQFTNNNLTVQSGTDKNRVSFGLGYILDQGIIKHEQLQKLNLSLNDELRVTKNIKLGAFINVDRQENPYNATGILDQARKVIPQISAGTKPFTVVNPYNNADTLTENLYSGLVTGVQNSGVVNPLLELQNTWNKQKSYEYRSVGNVYADITFLKYFTFRSTFYADISTVNGRYYSPLYYTYDPLTNTPYLNTSTTSVSENDQTYRKFQGDQILSFRKQFGDHSLTATAGFTTYYFGNFNRYGNAKQFGGPSGKPIPDDPRFWYITNSFADPSNSLASSSQTEYTTVSELARVLYNYKSKYFFNASFRNDASSQIPAKNRNQQFWALGGAWDISKENFMSNQQTINFLKIKGSVGVLGNQTASMPDGTPINYPAYPNLNTGINALFGTNIYGASQPAYIASPDLHWETVHAWEAGVELNAFDNRLHFEGNYFNRTTKDLMTFIDNSSLGLPNKLINGGSIRNWGEELTASWNQNFSKDLTVNIGGNITFLKNKVLSVSSEVPRGIIDITQANNGAAISEFKAGEPIGYFKGYIVEGIFQSYADILKSPSESSLGTGTIRPGDFKYKDVNGDGVINSDDRTFIGNPTPKFNYGFSLNITYKKFNLSADFGGVYGNQVYRLWGSLESPFQRVNYAAFQLERWHGAGTSNWVPIISQADRVNYNGSTYSIEDGSYFRIRNLQLGYTFPVRSNSLIKNFRLYVNAQNLKTWKNNLGYTPEFGGNALAFGYDYGGGAIPVVTTLGLNITF